jgi:hypothetical protein
MSEPHSDALIFFGATGDLAYPDATWRARWRVPPALRRKNLRRKNEAHAIMPYLWRVRRKQRWARSESRQQAAGWFSFRAHRLSPAAERSGTDRDFEEQW